MIRLLLLAFLSMLVLKGVVFAESGPVFSDTGPDAEAYALLWSQVDRGCIVVLQQRWYSSSQMHNLSLVEHYNPLEMKRMQRCPFLLR